MASIEIDRTDLGLTWTVQEPASRSAHALIDGGRVWFVDPIDRGDAIERAVAMGTPAAVIQLLDRHNRDCAAVADRLDLPHLRLPASLPDTPFETIPIVSNRLWKEVALWWPDRRALIVAEAVGTNAMFKPTDAGAGVHIGLRLKPPRGALGGYEPEHLLVGHGKSIHGPAAAPALHEALSRSRRDLPGALVGMPKAMRG